MRLIDHIGVKAILDILSQLQTLYKDHKVWQAILTGHYFCYTCDLTVSKGCYSICARVCHRGHRVVYSRLSRFFCDCGAGGVRGTSCLCLKPRKYVSSSTLMNGLCKKGSLEEANNIFKLMLEKGLVPNVQIYSKMIISNCERGCIKGALKLHYEMQDKGLLPALETYHSLIYRLCKERDTNGALTIYNEMEAKSMFPSLHPHTTPS